MKTDNFRRSDNVEDYRDPNKPIDKRTDFVFEAISEIIKLANSTLAKEAGSDDVGTAAGCTHSANKT